MLETTVPAVNSALQRAGGDEGAAPGAAHRGRPAPIPRTPSASCWSVTSSTPKRRTRRRSSRFSSGVLDAAAARTLGGARQVVGSWVEGGFGTDVRLDALRGHPRQPPAGGRVYVRRPGVMPARSTCCGSPAAPSPRSSPSTGRCSACSICPGRSERGRAIRRGQRRSALHRGVRRAGRSAGPADHGHRGIDALVRRGVLPDGGHAGAS